LLLFVSFWVFAFGFYETQLTQPNLFHNVFDFDVSSQHRRRAVAPSRLMRYSARSTLIRRHALDSITMSSSWEQRRNRWNTVYSIQIYIHILRWQ